MQREHGLDTMVEGQVWTELQEAVSRLRTALGRGDRPTIEAYLPPATDHRALFLAELVHEELEHRLRAGEHVSVRSYLDQYEELRSDPRIKRELSEAVSFWQMPGRLRGAGVCTVAGPISVGRYELGEIIGRGAFGVVHRAWDTQLRRTVALKRPRPGAVETAEAVERFLREARAAAGLRHPGIVPVHDAGQADGEVFLVSDLIEGRNLADELAMRRPNFRRSARWIAALAEALEHAHSLGLIHRDVKPSNVLIDAEDRVYLTDFGLAKNDGGEATLTTDGQFIGTPAYMAPEQTEGGKKPVDARTDVYGLGVILYELLTGSRPFAGTGAMLLARIREEEPRPLRRRDGAIPRDLETICLKAMAKEPAHRYADAAALAADLERWLAGEPVSARPVGPIGRIARTCRRRPVLSGLAASLLLAIVAGFIGVAWEWRRAEGFRRRAQANLVEMRAQRDRATRALHQGHRSLQTLNSLARAGQFGQLQPQYRRALQSLLSQEYRAYRRESAGDPSIRRDLANAAVLIAQSLEGTASPEKVCAAWQEAHDLYEGLPRDGPGDLLDLDRFGQCLAHQARFLCRLGRTEQAEAVLTEARDRMRLAGALAETLVARNPHDARSRRYLAAFDLALGEFERDLGHIPEAIAALRRARDRALANLNGATGEDEEAFKRAADVHVKLIQVLAQTRPDEAIDETSRAAEWINSLPRDAASSSSSRAALAVVLYNVASREDRVNRAADALRHFRQAVEIYESLEHAGNLPLAERTRQALAYHVIGRLHVENGRPGEALEPLRKAIAILEAMHAADPDNPTCRHDCGGSWHRLGEAFEDLVRYDEALVAYRKGIAYRRPLATRMPDEIRYRQALDEQFRDLARLSRKMGRPDDAAEAARQRKALWPGNPAVALSVAGELAATAFLPRPGEPFLDLLLNDRRRRQAVAALAALRDASRLTAENSLVSTAPRL